MSLGQWKGRRFCSRACSNRWRSAQSPKPVRHCSACGTSTAETFAGKCRRCYDQARYQREREHRLSINRRWREQNPGYFKQPHLVKRATEISRRKRYGGLYETVMERDARACQDCGSATDLHVHHVDSDVTHNVMENLMVLCGTCHRRTHVEQGDYFNTPTPS